MSNLFTNLLGGLFQRTRNRPAPRWPRRSALRVEALEDRLVPSATLPFPGFLSSIHLAGGDVNGHDSDDLTVNAVITGQNVKPGVYVIDTGIDYRHAFTGFNGTLTVATADVNLAGDAIGDGQDVLIGRTGLSAGGTARFPAIFNGKGTTNSVDGPTGDLALLLGGADLSADAASTQVGQRTNYDKLVLEIWTNAEPGGGGDDLLFGGLGSDRDDTNGHGTHGAGGGGGAGKVSMQDMHFVAKMSKATPKLFLAAADGEHFSVANFGSLYGLNNTSQSDGAASGDGSATNDVNGHGTHVSGTVAAVTYAAFDGRSGDERAGDEAYSYVLIGTPPPGSTAASIGTASPNRLLFIAGSDAAASSYDTADGIAMSGYVKIKKLTSG